MGATTDKIKGKANELIGEAKQAAKDTADKVSDAAHRKL